LTNLAPTREELDSIFLRKYGSPLSWSPRLRRRFGYFTPDDVYETVVAARVKEGVSWLDVGGGRDIFPSNPAEARRLTALCRRVTGVDPSDNILENPFVTERVQSFIEDYESAEPFDLLTLRMVAEHIEHPRKAVAAMRRLVRPGGAVVLYTVNKSAPTTWASWALPFRTHHFFKRVLWNSEERDTFPVVYKMNTRRRLHELFQEAGFEERLFLRLPDCRIFTRWRWLNALELSAWRLCEALALPYPESCLLGVYERGPA
jgi:2-polyprenyl-3-methyl-5-hydroxy-6-metoxy-1,4-benzoquinol methylase